MCTAQNKYTADVIGKTLHNSNYQPPYETFAVRLKYFNTLIYQLFVISFDITIFPNIVCTIYASDLILALKLNSNQTNFFHDIHHIIDYFIFNR